MSVRQDQAQMSDGRSGPHSPRAFAMSAGIVASIFLFLYALEAMGLDTAAAVFGYIILYGFVVIVASWLVGWLVRRVAMALTGTDLRVALAVLHWDRWTALTAEEAIAAWATMGRLPVGGELISGWRSRSAAVVWLECRDASGRRINLVSGELQKVPESAWAAGLYVRMCGPGPRDTGVTWFLRAFERLTCRWAPLEDADAELERPLLGEGINYVCRDCGDMRFMRTDSDGRPMAVLVGDEAGPTVTLLAGVYVAVAIMPSTQAAEQGAQ